VVGDEFRQRVGIGRVGRHAGQCGMVGQLGGIADDGRHLVATIERFGEELGADIAGGADESDFHGLSFCRSGVAGRPVR
jgi:hypothetical protein